MRVLRSAVILLSGVAAVVGGAAFAADGKVDGKPVYVELKGSDTVHLDATKESDAVLFPLRVPPGVEVTGVKLVQVMLDGQRGPAAFTPTLVPGPGANSGPPQSLSVAVDLALASKPGTYVVTLEIAGKPAPSPTPAPAKTPEKAAAKAGQPTAPAAVPAPPPLQVLEVKLVHAEAQLKVQGPVVIEREVWIPWLCVSTTNRTKLQIRETGGASRATHLLITPMEASRKDRREGTLVLVGPPQSVPAGASAEAAYRIDGDFSMGTAQGTLEIASAEVRAPLTVNYEVRSRLVRLWVFVLIGLGLLMGFALRTFIPRFIAAKQSVVDVADVLFELERYRRDPDDGLRQTAASLADSLSKAFDQHEADSAMKTRIADARTALAAAVQACRELAGVTGQAIRTLENLLAVGLFIPVDLARALDACRPDVRGARAAFDKKNFSAAQVAIASATEGLRKAVEPLVGPWSRALGDALGQLQSLEADLPAAARPGLEGLGEAMKTVAGFDVARPGNDPIDPIDLLFKVADVRMACRNLGARLAHAVSAEAAGVLATLADLNDPVIAADLESLKTALALLARVDVARPESGELAPALRAATVAARAPVTRLWGLVDRWKDKEDQRASVRGKLDSGQLRAAAEEIKDALGVAPPSKSAGVKFNLSPPKVHVALARPIDMTAALAIPATVSQPRRQGPTPAQQETAKGWIRKARRVQYVLATGVILAIGTATLGESFVGTPFEVLGLFFWGFGTDVSVATATELAPRKKA